MVAQEASLASPYAAVISLRIKRRLSANRFVPVNRLPLLGPTAILRTEWNTLANNHSLNASQYPNYKVS